eukprot:714111-Rhodomonas_salina.1
MTGVQRNHSGHGQHPKHGVKEDRWQGAIGRLGLGTQGGLCRLNCSTSLVLTSVIPWPASYVPATACPVLTYVMPLPGYLSCCVSKERDAALQRGAKHRAGSVRAIELRYCYAVFRPDARACCSQDAVPEFVVRCAICVRAWCAVHGTDTCLLYTSDAADDM